MLKILRADFYRLFKSRTMWGVWILSAVALVFYPVISFLMNTYSYVLDLIPISIQHYVALVFICIFLEREFDSHSYKNLADKSVNAKFHYVSSKVIVILTVIIVFYLVELMLYTVIGLARYFEEFGWGFFVGIEYPPVEGKQPIETFKRVIPLAQSLKGEALGLLFTVAAAMVILMLFTLIRNGIAVSVISILYLALSLPIYMAISAILPFSYMDICYHTVFGNFAFHAGSAYDSNLSLAPKQAIFGVVAIVVYLGLSWLFTCVREER